MLREIELANVRIRDVELHAGGRATLRLPMSKMDHGCDRSIHCCCALAAVPDGDVRGSKVCAACAVRRQLLWRYKHGGQPSDHLFCDSKGQAVEKKQMVRSWQRLAAQGGSERGSEDISGHSARRSGAKMLCRCGWDLWKVQFHARWASDTVKLYTEEVWSEQAHLLQIRARDEHDTCPDPRRRWATRTGLDEVREEVERLEAAESQAQDA